MIRTLVIDDDAGVRESIVQALKGAGHEVFSAANGREGALHLQAIRPDLLIIDLFMPEREGLETITAVHRKFPRIAVLAISGGSMASPAMLSVALQLGATNALEKPFGRDGLLAAVEKTLQMHSRHETAGFEPEVGPILPESH